MLTYYLVVTILLKAVTGDAPLHPSYLPPDTTFLGYPPSMKPQLPPPAIISVENDDPESIVIDAPPFGRNVNELKGVTDISSRTHANVLYMKPPLSASADRNSITGGSSFTHFHGGPPPPPPSSAPSSYSIGGGDGASRNVVVYRQDQNYYARTNDRLKPPADAVHHNTLSSSLNYSRLYQGAPTGSTPYPNYENENIFQRNLPDTKGPAHDTPSYAARNSYPYSSGYLGSPINTYRTSSTYYPSSYYSKDQHHYENNDVYLNAQNHNTRHYHSNTDHKFNNNNQYLPPSTSVQQDTGYSYQLPSTPFSYDNKVTKNDHSFTKTENSDGKNVYLGNCQTSFK